MTDVELTPSAECPCGWSKEVTAPEDGQTLYGTLGWYIARHENQCADATQKQGQQVLSMVEFNHSSTPDPAFEGEAADD